MKILFFTVFTLLYNPCMGYRFLVASFHDSGSHQRSLSKIFFELAQRGNEVVVLDSTSKKQQAYHENVEYVYVPTTYDEKYRNSYEDIVWRTHLGVTATYYGFRGSDNFLGLLMNEQPQKMTNILNTQFDVVIVDDIFASHAMWIADWLKSRENVPYVIYGTSLMLDLFYFSAGHMRHPLSRPIVPVPLLDDASNAYAPEKSIINRLTLLYTQLEPLNLAIFGGNAVKNLEKLNDKKFNFANFYANAAFGFSESFDRIGISTSQTVDFRGTGVNCITKASSLPDELLKFIEDPTSNGTIVVALGSNANWQHAPEYIKTAFWGALQTFSNFRIIFTYGDLPQADIPSHIKVMKWAPQEDLLQHPSIKLFVSHAGLKSLNEAICAGVPLIVMPLFAEQQYNAKLLVALGHAISVNKYTVTKEILTQKILLVMNNWLEKKVKATRLSKVYKDRYMPSVKEAAFFLERVAKTKGKGMSFKKQLINLHIIELFGLDWIMLVFAVVCFIGLK